MDTVRRKTNGPRDGPGGADRSETTPPIKGRSRPRARAVLPFLLAAVLLAASLVIWKSRSSTPSVSIGIGDVRATVDIGSPVPASPPAGVLNEHHQPDFPLGVLPASGGPPISPTVSAEAYLRAWSRVRGPWLVFWPTGVTSRAITDTPFPGPHARVSPRAPLIPSDHSWDNGGAWLSSVFRLGGPRLVGFFHAEHHYGCPPMVPRCPSVRLPNGQVVFWASGGVAYSDDNGATWSPGRQFLTSFAPQPAFPALGGADFKTAVWDFQRHRWVAFYGCQRGMSCAAVSYDRAGRPGTWRKYNGGRFDQLGLGGVDTPLPGLTTVPGALYSVAYNSSIGAWVGWARAFASGGVFVTMSRDLIHWSTPVRAFRGKRAFDSVLVGTAGTQVVGSSGRLYYVTGVLQGARSLKWRPVRITPG